MRILTIYDSFSKGGLESQVAGQARVISEEGVEMFLATGVPKKTVQTGIFKAILGNLSLKRATTFAQLHDTLEQLDGFIQKHGITAIHAHPFFSTVVGALAAQKAGLPFVVTLHGPVSITGMKGPVLELLFLTSVLPAAETVFCVSRETELLCQASAHCNTQVLPNAVEIPDEKFDPVVSLSIPWMWAGRIDSFKLAGLRDLIDKMRGLDRELHVYGEGSAREELVKFLEENGSSFDFVEVREWHEMLPGIMRKYAVIAGMGRVILEAAVRDRICLLVGYDGVKGILDRGDLERARLWNFSGRGLVTIGRSDLQKELSKWKKSPGNYAHADWVKVHHSEKAIWQCFLSKIKNMKPLDNKALATILDALSLQGDSEEVVWESSEFAELLEGLLSNPLLGKDKSRLVAEQKRAERQERALLTLRSERDDLKNHHKSLAAELETAKQQNIELAARLAGESKKATVLAAELETVKLENGELTAHLAVEAKARGEKNTSLQQQLDETLARLSYENETVLQLRNESIGYLETINRISDLNTQLHQRVIALENSTSWKVTKPLRSLVEAICIMKNVRRTPARLRHMRYLYKTGGTKRLVGWTWKRMSEGRSPLVMALPGSLPTSIQEPKIHSLPYSVDDTVERRKTSYEGTAPQINVAMYVDRFCEGGVERVIIDLCLNLKKMGLNPLLIVGNEVTGSLLELRDHNIGCCLISQNTGELEKALSRNNVSVVFTHYGYSMLDVIRACGIPIVEVLHNAYHWQVSDDCTKQCREKYIDSYIAVSEFVRDFNCQLKGIEGRDITVVNNGLNTNGLIRPPMDQLKEHRLDTLSSPHFVFLANLHEQKNHILVLRAFSEILDRYPDAQLTMPGTINKDSPLYKDVSKVMDKHGLADHLTLPGQINRREVSKVLSMSHIALLPSVFEGFSIATLEYTFFGLPSILSATGAANQLARQYGHVKVVPEASLKPDQLASGVGLLNIDAGVEKTAAAMAEVLRDYSVWLDQASKAAERYQEYSIEATANRYAEIAQEQIVTGQVDNHNETARYKFSISSTLSNWS